MDIHGLTDVYVYDIESDGSFNSKPVQILSKLFVPQEISVSVYTSHSIIMCHLKCTNTYILHTQVALFSC